MVLDDIVNSCVNFLDQSVLVVAPTFRSKQNIEELSAESIEINSENHDTIF